MVQRAGYSLMTASDAFQSASNRAAALTFDDGYADNLEVAVPLLQSLGARATIYVVAGEIGRAKPSWYRPAAEHVDRLLTAAELRQLLQAGWEIGSHCCQHVRLAQLPESVQREELGRSKAMLEDLLGAPVLSLAYPYGEYSLVTERLAAESGYTHAFSTAKRGGSDSAYALKRYSLGGYGLRSVRQLLKLQWALWQRTGFRRRAGGTGK